MRRVAVAFLLLVSLCATAAQPSGVWRTPNGEVLAETSARRSVQGFGVWLAATPDQDWEAKWNTPSSIVPHFTEASSVRRGGKLTLLVFFSNPQPDRTGKVSVVCDIAVSRPDGSYSINAPNISCMDGPHLGKPANLRLGAPVIVFVAEPKDQAGVWRARVVVRDRVRNVEIPVHTSFALED